MTPSRWCRAATRSSALIARAHIALAQGEPEQAERDAHDALVIAAHTHGFLRAARYRRVSGATGRRRWQ